MRDREILAPQQQVLTLNSRLALATRLLQRLQNENEKVKNDRNELFVLNSVLTVELKKKNYFL